MTSAEPGPATQHQPARHLALVRLEDDTDIEQPAQALSGPSGRHRLQQPPASTSATYRALMALGALATAAGLINVGSAVAAGHTHRTRDRAATVPDEAADAQGGTAMRQAPAPALGAAHAVAASRPAPPVVPAVLRAPVRPTTPPPAYPHGDTDRHDRAHHHGDEGHRGHGHHDHAGHNAPAPSVPVWPVIGGDYEIRCAATISAAFITPTSPLPLSAATASTTLHLVVPAARTTIDLGPQPAPTGRHRKPATAAYRARHAARTHPGGGRHRRPEPPALTFSSFNYKFAGSNA